jgi:hypothetical protein
MNKANRRMFLATAAATLAAPGLLSLGAGTSAAYPIWNTNTGFQIGNPPGGLTVMVHDDGQGWDGKPSQLDCVFTANEQGGAQGSIQSMVWHLQQGWNSGVEIKSAKPTGNRLIGPRELIHDG